MRLLRNHRTMNTTACTRPSCIGNGKINWDASGVLLPAYELSLPCQALGRLLPVYDIYSRTVERYTSSCHPTRGVLDSVWSGILWTAKTVTKLTHTHPYFRPTCPPVVPGSSYLTKVALRTPSARTRTLEAMVNGVMPMYAFVSTAVVVVGGMRTGCVLHTSTRRRANASWNRMYRIVEG